MDHTISNGVLTVTVSSRGAELREVTGSSGTEYLWSGDAAYWPDRSPLLFPYVGRFTEGAYRYRGKRYAMDIHGFARGMEFTRGETGPAFSQWLLEDTPETLAVYPFQFRLSVRYALDGDRLLIRYQVRNRSEDMMYFGIGGHPGFRVPLEEGLAFDDYFLAFSLPHKPARVGHSPACFLNGHDSAYPLLDDRILPLSHALFDQDAVVLKNVAGSVTLKSSKGSRGVTVDYPQMAYLGLWHAPKTQAPYLCIEPWTSLPSREGVVEDLECKSDLIRLEPGGTYENRWSIRFH